MIEPRKIELVKYEDLENGLHDSLEECNSENELIILRKILDFADSEFDYCNEEYNSDPRGLQVWLCDNKEKIDFLLKREEDRRNFIVSNGIGNCNKTIEFLNTK